jgi:hypothetical protein
MRSRALPQGESEKNLMLRSARFSSPLEGEGAGIARGRRRAGEGAFLFDAGFARCPLTTRQDARVLSLKGRAEKKKCIPTGQVTPVRCSV